VLACGARNNRAGADGAGPITFRVYTIFAGPASSWRCERGVDEGGWGSVASYGCKHTRIYMALLLLLLLLLDVGVLDAAPSASWVVMLGDDRVVSAAAAWCALKVKATGLVLCKRTRAPHCATARRLCRPRSQPAVRAFAWAPNTIASSV